MNIVQIINSLWSKWKNNFTSVGVDLGNANIKLVILSKNKRSYRVEGYALVSIDSYDTKTTEVDLMTHALRRARARLCSAVKNVVLGLPDKAVITKTIQVSAALREDELEHYFAINLKQHLAYSSHEVNFDFQLLGENHKDTTQQDVLLVASHKSNIDPRNAAITACGMTVGIIDVQSYAIERVVRLLQEFYTTEMMQLVGVIDLSATTMTLIVLRNTAVIFSRSENYVGVDVTAVFVKLITIQVQHILQVFYSNYQHGRIARLILIGGGSLHSGLAEQIQAELDTPVLVGNPFLGMDISAAIDVEELWRIAPALFLCTGFALRSFEED